MAGIGLGIALPFGTTGFSAAFIAGYARVVAEGGSLTSSEQVAINAYINAIGITEFDRLWIHGVSNQIAARVSWANPATADLITEINAPTFTSGQGYTGDGVSKYLNSNYNPATQGVKYTQDNASFGTYLRTNIDFPGDSMGSQDLTNKSRIAPRSVDLIYSAANESTGAALSNASNTNSSGLITSARNNATNVMAYRNGVSLLNVAVASNGVPNANFFILALNLNGAGTSLYTGQTALTFMSSGAINQASFYTSTQLLGTSLGWSV